jgi:hypothetical protein
VVEVLEIGIEGAPLRMGGRRSEEEPVPRGGLLEKDGWNRGRMEYGRARCGDRLFQRSIRRGSTAQTRNERVPKDVINGNNRWRAEVAAKEGRAAAFGGNMMERSYTDVRAAVESLLRYSEAL